MFDSDVCIVAVFVMGNRDFFWGLYNIHNMHDIFPNEMWRSMRMISFSIFLLSMRPYRYIFEEVVAMLAYFIPLPVRGVLFDCPLCFGLNNYFCAMNVE